MLNGNSTTIPIIKTLAQNLALIGTQCYLVIQSCHPMQRDSDRCPREFRQWALITFSSLLLHTCSSHMLPGGLEGTSGLLKKSVTSRAIAWNVIMLDFQWEHGREIAYRADRAIPGCIQTVSLPISLSDFRDSSYYKFYWGLDFRVRLLNFVWLLWIGAQYCKHHKKVTNEASL